MRWFKTENMLKLSSYENYFCGPKTLNPCINEGGSTNQNLLPGNSGTWKSSTVGILDQTIYYT
jgi:hypothetical protein